VIGQQNVISVIVKNKYILKLLKYFPLKLPNADLFTKIEKVPDLYIHFTYPG